MTHWSLMATVNWLDDDHDRYDYFLNHDPSATSVIPPPSLTARILLCDVCRIALVETLTLQGLEPVAYELFNSVHR